MELIQRAVSLGAKDAGTLMILAAAQAETGDFRTAAETVKDAIKLAKQERNADCLRELEQQFSYYKKSKPHPGAVA
jgi:cytochrome c-type biogenesis protein CcmH/NrfG